MFKRFQKILLIVVVFIIVVILAIFISKSYKTYRLEYLIRQNMNAGMFIDNISLYNQMIEIRPIAENYMNRAFGYMYTSDYEMAVIDLNQALAMDSRLNSEAKAMLFTIKNRVSEEEYNRLLSMITNIDDITPTATPSPDIP